MVLRRRPFVVIGAGGLGCPAILGLVAAGVQDLTIVDPDTVDISNLQRQVLYRNSDRGRDKLAVVQDRIAELNPSMRLATHRFNLRAEQCSEWLNGLPDHAVVLDCSDNPELKFAINDACVSAGRICIIGGVTGWKGHIMAIQAKSACFRCVFECPPPADLAPSCNIAGIVGTVAGILGYWMAQFAILALSDDSIGGTLLAYDLLNHQIRRIHPRPRNDCPACATRSTAQYRQFRSSKSPQVFPS